MSLWLMPNGCAVCWAPCSADLLLLLQLLLLLSTRKRRGGGIILGKYPSLRRIGLVRLRHGIGQQHPVDYLHPDGCLFCFHQGDTRVTVPRRPRPAKARRLLGHCFLMATCPHRRQNDQNSHRKRPTHPSTRCGRRCVVKVELACPCSFSDYFQSTC
jgi:hypothetical protein